MDLYTTNANQCPNCGGILNRSEDHEWITRIDDEMEIEILVCPQCGYSPVNIHILHSSHSNPRTIRNYRKSRNWLPIVIIGLIAALTGALIFWNRKFDGFADQSDIGQGLYYLALLSLLCFSLMVKGKLRSHIRNGIVWLGIFLFLFFIYSYRIELKNAGRKMVSHLIPGYGMVIDNRSMVFPRASDGHFYIRAKVNGHTIRFLVDTGASHIILNRAAAEKLGFHPDTLNFSTTFHTANGSVNGAAITIDSFSIGPFHAEPLTAFINQAPMKNNLLGMSFFNCLESYKVENNLLTLIWSSSVSQN